MQTPYFPSASLYVGDLASDVTEGHLFDIFNRVGPVALIRVCRDAVSRRSLGYAYVNFHSPIDAERALDILNNTPIKGKPCRIMWSQRDPTLRKSGVGNVFIKNLDKSVDLKALHDTFSPFGNILSCKVALDANNVSKGYGFVHYETQEMANAAISQLNGSTIFGKIIYVEHFVPRKERRKQNDENNFTNVFVKNLEDNINDEKLKEIFNQYGTVTSAIVMTDGDKSKCFGFVNFENHEDALKSIEDLNGKTLNENGKPLFVGKAQKKSEREAELRQKFDQKRPEQQGVNLFVRNLDEDVDDERLKNEFTKFGTITSVKVMRDDKSKSKGYGFVCFKNPEEANRAVAEMKGKLLGTKTLFVAVAQNKKDQARRAGQYENLRVPGNGLGAAPQAPFPSTYPPFIYAPQGYPQKVVPRNRWPAQYQNMPNYMVPVQRQQRYSGRQNYGNNRRYNSRSNRDHQAQQSQVQQTQQQQQQPAQTQTQPQQQVAPAVQQNVDSAAGVPSTSPLLTSEVLSQYPPEQHATVIGDKLYPLIAKENPENAGKITGMLIERYSNAVDELLVFLNNPQALSAQVGEALKVLEEAAQQTSQE